jgi:hypothetical protein
VFRLADHNVWWDEGFSVYLARMPLREMVVRTAADVHPPVHYAFLHYWDRLVGESEYAIRYSTALLGVLDLALLFWLLRRYLGAGVALAATLLLAVNRLHVEWSQEMRMYTLATALVLGSTACFLRLVHERDWRLRWWLGHLVLTVVGLHTIYVFGLAPLSQSIVVLLGALVPLGGRRLPLGFLLRWCALQVLALALFVPWVLLFLAQPRAKPVLIYPIDLVTWTRAVLTALPIGISAYLERWTLVTLAATALFLLPLVILRRRPAVLLTAYVPILIGPALLYGLSYPNPVLYAPNLSVRYLMLFLPLYCGLVALGLLLVARRARPVAALLGLAAVAVCLWTTNDLYWSRYRKDEYRTIASFIHSYALPGDAIVLNSDWDWPVFEYYAGTSMPRYGIGTDRPQTAESAAGLLGGWLDRHPGIWLVTLNDAYDSDPQGHIRRWLEGHARVIADFTVDNKRLTYFSRLAGTTLDRRVLTRPQRTLSWPDGSAPAVVGYDWPVDEAVAGDRLRVATYWRGLGGGSHLELVAPTGEVMRRVGAARPAFFEREFTPGIGSARIDQELPLSPRLQPGRYSVRLAETVGGQEIQLGRLGDLRIRPPERPPKPALAPPSPPLPKRDDRFGGDIALVGVVVPDRLPAAGESLRLRLLWQAIRAMERPYTAFAQLVGSTPNPATGNPVWAQLDGAPDREAPTSDWLPGDLALDERALPLGTLPAGRYRLIVGLYDPDGGARLKLPDGADYVELASYTVP